MESYKDSLKINGANIHKIIHLNYRGEWHREDGPALYTEEGFVNVILGHSYWLFEKGFSSYDLFESALMEYRDNGDL